MAVRLGRGAALATLGITSVLAGGCASSAFQAQEEAAERHIASAEETGVDDEHLDEARDLLDEAEDAEERALDEREEAQEDLAEAQHATEEAKGRVAARERRLSSTMAALIAAESEAGPVEEEYQAMLGRGLSPSEARALIGPRLRLFRQRAEGLRHARRAQELELELGRLELTSAQARAEAAEAQLRAADERLQLASALYDLARERAETLELEVLTNQHSRVRQRLDQLQPK